MSAATKRRWVVWSARLAPWISWALAATIAGCADPLTELVVVVDSDLRAPDEIDEVVVQASGASGLSQDARASLVGEAARGLPVSVGLVPASGGAGPVTVRALARRAGTTVLTHEVRTSFVAGRRLVLRIELARGCLAVAPTCGADERCVAGACAPAAVDPGSLPAFDGTLPAPRDLGVPRPDGGGDLGTPDGGDGDAGGGPEDAGPGDAGSDADTPVDASPPTDGSATRDAETDSGTDAGRPCTTDLECATRNPCVRGFCDMTTSRCATSFTTNLCDDGNACTTGDMCVAGVCRAGAAIRCDDGNACTTDACDPVAGCVYAPTTDGTICEMDGQARTCDVCMGGICNRFAACPGPCTCDASGFPSWVCAGSDVRCDGVRPE